MANPQLNELVDYIKKASQAGQTDQQTRQILSKNGWSDAEVNEAFASISTIKPQAQPQVKQPVQQPSQQSQQQQPRTQPQIKQPDKSPVGHFDVPATISPSSNLGGKPQYQLVENKKFRSGGGGNFVLRFFISLTVIIIIISVIGAGAALATRFWDPEWSPFRPGPETIILKAWDNLAQIKSENFNSELLLNSKDVKIQENGVSFNVSLKANGGVDSSDPQNKLASMQASLGATGTDDAGSNYDLSISGEIRLIGESLYVRVNDYKLGELEEFLVMFFGIDASKLKDQWIKFDEKDAQEAENKIVKILLDKKVYNIKQLPDNQGSAGVEYHYLISLDRAKLNIVLPEILGIFQEDINKYSPGTTTYFQKDINDALDKIGDLFVELFIGKADNLFHKIQLNKDLDISKFSDASSGTVKISYKSEQSGINQPVQVTVPDNYKNFQQVMEEISGPIIRAQKVNSDMSRISEIAQSYFDSSKSYYYLCSRGYLNGSLKTYGAEFVSLSKDMVAQKAGWANCFSNIQNFCISAQLEDKSWICISKDGWTGTTKCASATTVCR
ncbi:MAG: hypothetical protein AAB509_00585 [Patescibacteria group bacterium]